MKNKSMLIALAFLSLIIPNTRCLAFSLVGTAFTYQGYTVRYDAVNAMLLNEFLKEHSKVEAQSAEMDDLKARLETLEQIINSMKENSK